ncbi:TonB-dependent receptor [Corallincola holothuriorum]|uniref:TonB-dependent receptor n=1 Tax=Corallincola holothuriorum TaxID=2282215 RepID=A0A368NMZ7_9GAMM|nr:TonB-dependent receptor [Corallincola holothuriorum]RCU50839.1 TonB-dependent receptor [Corallincola holothuriorum]
MPVLQKNTVVKTIALFAGVPLLAQPAFADDSTAEDVERIEITGSRIKRADMESASPVQLISAEDIAAGSYTSVEQVLQQSTASAGMATGASSNNGGVGAARVDMRGMGVQRTLVLVNGRRMVNSGTGADAAVDLNTIPLAMIERIEVLKDGASAVYGSDAIAGVVNIITKKNFEGLELSGTYGGSSEGDANTGDISLLMGGSSDRGNFVVGASYVDRGDAWQSDRGWSDCALDGSTSPSCIPGSSTIPGGAINPGDGWKQRDPNTGEWVAQTDSFDYVPYSYLYTPQERVSVFGNGSYELNDDLTAFTEFLYTKRTSDQQMAPSPVTGVTFSEDALGNPYDSAVSYKRRMTEAGAREFEQITDTTRIVTGLQGYLDLGSGYDWDLSYTWGRNDATSKVHNLINNKKMMETAYADTCGQNGVPCQDWFAPEGEISQETLDYVTYTDQSTGGNEMNVVNFNLSGDAFELPTGTVGFAAGLEYREEKGWYQPDSVTVAGESSQSQQDATSGSYDTTSAYAEFAIPLLSDMRFADDVSLEAAVRWFDYSTFGSDNTWKLGLTWKVDDEWMLRGVRSTAFRAPSVDELYGGNVGSFDYVTDPCSGYGALDPSSSTYQMCHSEIGDTNYQFNDFQIESTWLSDDDLQPETADTWTFGVVYSPDYIDNLSLTIDYYKIEIDDAIVRIDSQQYLDACYGGNAQACDTLNISRDSLTGEISNVDRPLTNVGYQNTSGIDSNIQYGFEGFGIDWSANLDSTYLIEFEEDGNDYAGTISGMTGGYARWRSNASLKAAADNWDIYYKMRYIHSMDDLYEDYEVSSVTYHDVSGQYYVNDSLSLKVGIDNLFDKEPPYVPSYSDMNTVPEAYDVLGRYFYAGFTYRM